jgi:hypothetical protein
MKTLNESFTDQEFEKLQQAKNDYKDSSGMKKLSWHDFLMAYPYILRKSGEVQKYSVERIEKPDQDVIGAIITPYTCDYYPHSPDCAINRVKEAKTE